MLARKNSRHSIPSWKNCRPKRRREGGNTLTLTMIMIDIETLGVKPGCVVLSIGAVEFDKAGKFGKEFEVVIDPHNAEAWGLKLEADTVMWWMKQSEEARKKISTDGEGLSEALSLFIRAFNWKDAEVWANGASFDFPILEAAFNAVDMMKPWKYYNERCFRTIKGLVGKQVYEANKVNPTVAHSALDDAKAQAATLVKILPYVDKT